MSLVGFDDDIVCTIMHPKLTTVHQPVTEMAREATARIAAIRQGKARLTGEPVMFDYHLVERDSVAEVRGARRIA